MKKTGKTKPSKKTPTRRRSVGNFSTRDWRDIYDALMDASNVHHSGSKADRIVELARKIREAGLAEDAV
jgi:hypothetical protein